MQNTKISIVDVRTPGEFMGGNVAGSINIPLNEIPYRVEDFKNLEGEIVVCCASGNRSEQAAVYLKGQGINVTNGGSWFDVNHQYQTV